MEYWITASIALFAFVTGYFAGGYKALIDVIDSMMEDEE